MTQRATEAEAELANARAKASADQALIAHLKLQIAKLNRERFGPHAERSRRLLDQLELQLEELEASASEDDLAAEMAAAKTTNVAPFERKRPVRKPFRSEEHTSELQSLMRISYAVFCLKKKNQHTRY